MKHLLQAKSDSLFTNSLFIFLIRFFPSLANVLIVIFFSRELSTEAYGMYQIFWTRLFVISAIAGMGVQTFVLTYAPDTVRMLLKRLPRFFYIGFAMWLIGCSIVFACMQHTSFSMGWLLPFLFMLVYASSVIAESLLIVFKKFRLLVWGNFSYTVFFCLVHWLLLKSLVLWDNLFLLLILLAAIRLAIYVIACSKELGKETKAMEIDSLTGFRSLWLHLGIYDISQILFRWVDKFIISFIVGKELFAIYQNGAYDIPFLPLMLGAVAGAGLQHLAQKDLSDNAAALVMINKTGRLLSCIVFPLFFFFVLFRHELFSVILTSKYLASVPIFLMSVLAIPLRAYSFTTVLQNRHKGAIINTGAIFDLLLACALMYPLYQVMGLPGVALSFAISSYLQAVYYLYQTSRLLNEKVYRLIPLQNWVVKLIVFACLFIGFYYFIASCFEPPITLFWGSILLFVTTAVSFIIEYKRP